MIRPPLMCLAVLLLAAVSCPGQTTHSVTLNWNAPSDATAGTTYSVYRAPGPCTGTPVMAKIVSAIVPRTYVDTTVAPGPYCYAVTAVAGGAESVYSNLAPAVVPSFAPSSLTIIVQ
jgi:hypothetical protein